MTLLKKGILFSTFEKIYAIGKGKEELIKINIYSWVE